MYFLNFIYCHRNDWKHLKIAWNDYICFERAVQCSTLLELAGKSYNWLEMVCELMEMAWNSWAWLKMAWNEEYQSCVHSSVAAVLAWKKAERLHFFRIPKLACAPEQAPTRSQLNCKITFTTVLFAMIISRVLLYGTHISLKLKSDII